MKTKKLYPNVIVEAVLTKNEIARLREIYDECTCQYLTDLERDPFPENQFDYDMEEVMQKVYTRIDFQDSEKREFISNLKWYLL